MIFLKLLNYVIPMFYYIQIEIIIEFSLKNVLKLRR